MSHKNNLRAHTFDEKSKGMGFFRFLGFDKKNDLQNFINKGAVIVDVRTANEYASGHISGSKNIPLDTIKQQAENIKKLNKPVIACCRSGMRSSQAVSILKQHNIECINGGSWDSLQNKL
ncbi:rhodanese-like domain-containing protein [Flavobacterium columnare NBRC 100251 = ATCC 23463]|uniref:Rhodanese-like protein n=1 Tax=Flavobacterium columnare (strain ATCC 49512 / CIP 103533 / TG 44/87) TaxID=1041826 RepID=G8X696_FLACA|nr:rhodanese-like domain-containing protein [Flavobacterium columnare]AEW86937.1 Rhodanese-like protein [Flavobacterium columnare ATCC 49512]PDS25318.1 rhodanese-like domain-containing protein [Flavobacterium columnare NBRC 100251 = ATCC 23463]GEM57083.1 sulfurtransferase [Flavobacterium columnare NBRC 100251 = ATCC 23463]